MTSLADCWLGDTDKGSSAHNYLPFYERHLNPEEIWTLTEIGVWTGGSLRMWSRWIPHAKIIGLDNEPENYVEPSDTPYPHIEFRPLDVRDIATGWASDVVIDDGSHHGDDQLWAFDVFWPTLRPGGWYVIEDLETVFHDEFRDGAEMLSFIGHRTADAVKAGGQVSELHAYEQILFMRKR